jgi:hypothetical protein
VAISPETPISLVIFLIFVIFVFFLGRQQALGQITMSKVVAGANDPIACPFDLTAKDGGLHVGLADEPAAFAAQCEREAISGMFPIDGIEDVRYNFGRECWEIERPDFAN